jgi:hypothetical protein
VFVLASQDVGVLRAATVVDPFVHISMVAPVGAVVHPEMSAEAG